MKTIWKYLLSAVITAFLCFCWTCFFDNAFRNIIPEQRIALAVGLFLSFEMVVLSGIVISKIDKKK